MSLRGAELINKVGPALDANRLQVDGDLSLEGFRATGHGKDSAVQLWGAHVTGWLSLSGAELKNTDAGPALDANRLRVDRDVLLHKLQATGHGKNGAVRLTGAHVTGHMSLVDAKLINKTGPALDAIRLQVDGHISLQGLQATGHGKGGVVRLTGARVTGYLFLVDAELINEDGLVLDLEYAETKTIFLSPHVICPQGVAGRSICEVTARRVDLSDFVYTSLERSHWSQWLHLITCHTDGYRPQPYQQLAAVRRAAGHDADVRKILIAQQQDLRERGDLGGRLTRTAHRAWEHSAATATAPSGPPSRC